MGLHVVCVAWQAAPTTQRALSEIGQDGDRERRLLSV